MHLIIPTLVATIKEHEMYGESQLATSESRTTTFVDKIVQMLAQLASRIDNLFMFSLTSLLALRIFLGDQIQPQRPAEWITTLHEGKLAATSLIEA